MFLLFVFLLQSFASATKNNVIDGIDHVVAVMFENRALDHMLGHLKKFNPNFNGLTGQESNPIDPDDPTFGRQKVSFNAPDVLPLGPGHQFGETEFELWGGYEFKDPAPMNGFIKELTEIVGLDVEPARQVMQCYNETTLSVMSTLAREYGVFDHWFSSMPGPTWPNRLFAFSGTSHGMAHNNIELEFVKGFPQTSIFNDFREAGLDYKVYFSDFPTPFVLDDVARHPTHLRPILEFTSDARAGKLPPLSWVEMRFFAFAGWDEEDQHPQGLVQDGVPHGFSKLGTGSVKAGEKFLKYVYEELRNSPAWNRTLLLVYYDEHGGLYDHVSPPQRNVPNPDGLNSTDPNFSFDRLGLRVPALVIGPNIPKGSVFRAPPGQHYDHTSFLATLRKMFNVTPRPLTRREAWSADWHDHIANSKRSAPCPKNVPLSHASRAREAPSVEWLQKLARDEEEEYAAYIAQHKDDDGTLQAFLDAATQKPEHIERQKVLPLTHLQRDMVYLAHYRAAEHDKQAASQEFEQALTNMFDASMFIRKRMQAHQKK